MNNYLVIDVDNHQIVKAGNGQIIVKLDETSHRRSATLQTFQAETHEAWEYWRQLPIKRKDAKAILVNTDHNRATIKMVKD